MQISPTPLNPELQVHVKPGVMSVHEASALQLSVPSVHSLISTNDTNKKQSINVHLETH